MYISLDPNKISGLWDKLRQNLLINETCYLIIDGKKNNHSENTAISVDAINELIERMKKINYVRLGSSRLMSIPPHFAINFFDSNKGVLSELITVNNEFQEVINAINLVIQLSFYENPNLMELTIPFIIDKIDEDSVNIVIDQNNQCMLLKRKT